MLDTEIMSDGSDVTLAITTTDPVAKTYGATQTIRLWRLLPSGTWDKLASPPVNAGLKITQVTADTFYVYGGVARNHVQLFNSADRSLTAVPSLDSPAGTSTAFILVVR